MPSIQSVLSRVVRAVPLGAFELEFERSNPEAIAWARRHAAQLVTDIGNDARATIRTIIRLGFEEHMTVSEVAHLLRATIGLTERDALAVMRRQTTLMAAGTSVEKAQQAAERYATKLRNTRATTIARTETMRASNEGQLRLWRQAQANGLLSHGVRKVWITADACPRCAPLDGEEAPIDGDFSVGVDPPLHPRCRCTVGLSL